MRFVRVQYDASDRQFKMADRLLASQMEDGFTYLIADLSPSDFVPNHDFELVIAGAKAPPTGQRDLHLPEPCHLTRTQGSGCCPGKRIRTAPTLLTIVD